MFTGIIEELGTVKTILRGSKAVRLTVAAGKVLEDVRTGDSMAVNGTCLTVVDYSREHFTADAMPETVERTALAGLKPGDTVNLERAVAIGGRFGGHIVTGHIDGVGTIRAKHREENAVIVEIAAPSQVMKYVVKKGSVAIDGISLTVVDYTAVGFTVSLIPHTAAVTTLGFKTVGDLVNLEADIIGKYVERLLTFREDTGGGGGITLEFLARHGFIT